MISSIDPKVVKRFMRAMAVVGNKHAQRKEAHEHLEEHLAEIKKASSKKKNISKDDVSELHQHIKNVIEAEKDFAGYDMNSEEKVKILRARLAQVEQQLEQEKQKSALQIANYKHTIDDMKRTFASLKTKLIELINEKRERERKLDALHERIQQGVAMPSMPQPPITGPYGELLSGKMKGPLS